MQSTLRGRVGASQPKSAIMARACARRSTVRLCTAQKESGAPLCTIALWNKPENKGFNV